MPSRRPPDLHSRSSVRYHRPPPRPEPFWATTIRLVPRDLHEDGKIAWLAGRQHGAVSREQLLDIGISRHAIDRRLAHGSLRATHRGVYVPAGPPMTSLGLRTAALLASPPGSALSHWSSAEIWGIAPERRGLVHVTSPGRRSRRPRLAIHMSASVSSVTVIRSGLPCTNLSRTLVDLAAAGSLESTRRLWTTSASRRLLRPDQIEHELREHPNRPGTRVIHGLLAERQHIVRGRTRSNLEAACVRMCHDHRVPVPEVNTLIRIGEMAYEADLAWPRARLIAEIDTWGTHGHVEAFAKDRARDFTLATHGWRTVRLLEDDIVRRPQRTAEGLRRLLGE